MQTRTEIIKMISKEIWFEFLNKIRVVPGSLNIDLDMNDKVFSLCSQYVIVKKPKTIGEVFELISEFYEERGFVLDISRILSSNIEFKKDIGNIKKCGYDVYFYVEKRKRKIVIDVLEESVFYDEQKALKQFSQINKVFEGAPTELEWIFSAANKKEKLINFAINIIRKECEKIKEKHLNYLAESVEDMYENLEKTINEVKQKYSYEYIFEEVIKGKITYY